MEKRERPVRSGCFGLPLLVLGLLLTGGNVVGQVPGTNRIPESAGTNTNTYVPPQDEDERRAAMLRQFIDQSDEETLRAVARRFRLNDKLDLPALRTELSRYLGLLVLMTDSRRKAEIFVRDIFRSPDLNNNFVVQADEGTHVRSETDPESGLVTLRGEQGNLTVRHQKQLISARLLRLDLGRREIFAEGDAMMREDDRIITGDKFFFNSETGYGVIYGARTFIRPYYYWGDRIKRIGDRNYVLEDGWFTTCDAEAPHYRFGVSKAWLYQDLRMVAYDVTYQVSDFPLFWFPAIYHPISGTGLWTGIGRDTRVGWFVQVANIGSWLDLPFGLAFDYYQRLGIAMLGHRDLKGDNWTSAIRAGIAYDKPLQRLPTGTWVNAVDGNNIPGDEDGLYGDWQRDLRWKIDLNHSWTLHHDEKNKELGSTSFTARFNLASDPFFRSDFEAARVSTINIEKIYKMEDVSFFNQGGPEGRNWSFSLTDKRGGSSLSLAADWAFRTELNPAAENIYANDYYEYRKSSIVLPRVSYGYSGTLLSSTPKAGAATAATNTNQRPALTADGRPDVLALDDGTGRSAASGRLVNYSLAYSASIAFDQTKRYDQQEQLIEQRYTRSLTLNIPANLSIGEVLRSSLTLGLSDMDVWGDATTDAQRQNYRTSSITSLNENASLSIGHVANQGQLTEFGGNLSFTHRLALKISEVDDPSYAYKDIYQHALTMGAQLSLFRTKINVSTGYDLVEMKNETRQSAKERFSPLSFSLSSTPLDFLTISDSYQYVIRTGQSTANTLSITIKSDPFRLPFIDRIAGLTAGISWYHSYADMRSSRMTFSLGFSMDIHPLWKANFTMSSVNRELYLYSETEARRYGQEPRSFLKDLVYSFMIWDPDLLKESRFNVQALSFNLIHDLHDWELRFSTSVNQRVNSIGRRFSYFDFSFILSISMKENIGLTFPEQRYRYTADAEGRYYGTYN